MQPPEDDLQTIELNVLRTAVRRANIDAKDTAVMHLDGRVLLRHEHNGSKKKNVGGGQGRAATTTAFALRSLVHMWKLVFGALLGLGQLQADEIPAELKNSFQIISNLADEIKGCPASLYEEKHWGTKANEIERDYLDQPKNLVWDGEEVPHSLRAPYRAFIEFTSHYFEWVPPDTKAKYDRMSRLPSFHLGEWRFRYEFDINADAVKFTQAFVFYPSGRGKSEPFSRTDMCWDKSLRQSDASHR